MADIACLNSVDCDRAPRGFVLSRRASFWVSAGVVAARLDWNKLSAGGANVNALTSETLTDLGGGPTFYSTLVEVRKVCR